MSITLQHRVMNMGWALAAEQGAPEVFNLLEVP